MAGGLLTNLIQPRHLAYCKGLLQKLCGRSLIIRFPKYLAPPEPNYILDNHVDHIPLRVNAFLWYSMGKDSFALRILYN